MKQKKLVLGIVFVCFLLPITWVSAHSIISVNGAKDTNEWLAGFGSGGCLSLPADNNGTVYSGPPCTGPTGSEYIWKDAVGDQRTDHWNGTGNMDLKEFRVTGDATNVNFLLEFSDITNCDAQYIAIALDNNKVTAGSNNNFPDFADTTLPFNFEYIIETNTTTTGVWNKDYVYSSSGSSFCSTTNNLWEIQIPVGSLGVTWPANAGEYQFAVGIFCNSSGGICDVSGSSDAMDVITTVSGNTWNEVGDGNLGYYFTPEFSPTAITLTDFTARSAMNTALLASLALIMLGVGAAALRRRM